MMHMYDAIIIGSDVSSLIAAARLSRFGKKTVFLNETDYPYVFRESGYTFNIDPLPLTGFGNTQTCFRLFNELDIPSDKWSNIQLLEPGLQIILPDHRIELYCDRNALINDMMREFGGHAEILKNLYASIEKSSSLFELLVRDRLDKYSKNIDKVISYGKNAPAALMDKLSLLKAYRAIQDIQQLKKVFEAQLAIFSHNHSDGNLPLSITSSYILSLPMKGIFYFAGGNDLIRTLLEERFEAFGGRIIKNCNISNIEFNGAVDVTLKSDGEPSKIKGKYLIASVRWGKFKKFLFGNRKLRHLKRRFNNVKIMYNPFTLHMGVFEKGMPERMGTNVIIVGDPDKPVMKDSFIFLESSRTGDRGRAPSGKRTLSATVFLTESPLSLSDDELKEISASMLHNLEPFLPFLKENLDYMDVEHSILMSRKYRELIHQRYSIRTDPIVGLINMPNSTPLRNVYMTGGALLADLGFEGEILSGMNAATSVIVQEVIK